MQPLQLSRSSRHRVGRRKQKLKMKLLFKFIFLLVLIQVARIEGATAGEDPCKDKITDQEVKNEEGKRMCDIAGKYKKCLTEENNVTNAKELLTKMCAHEDFKEHNVSQCAECKNETKTTPTTVAEKKTTQAKNGKSSTASPKGATTTKKKETEHKEDGEGAAPGRELPVALIGAAALVAVAMRPLLD